MRTSVHSSIVRDPEGQFGEDGVVHADERAGDDRGDDGRGVAVVSEDQQVDGERHQGGSEHLERAEAALEARATGSGSSGEVLRAGFGCSLGNAATQRKPIAVSAAVPKKR